MIGAKICIICEAKDAEKAHVRPRRFFEKHQNHQQHNIIHLCHDHHYNYFDKGKIGICPNKQKMIIEYKPGLLKEIFLPRALNIRSEYIREKNELCNDRIRHALGLTPQSSGKLCAVNQI
jgi:hypothetical protein